MSYFHPKDFEGTHYPLGHLDPFSVQVPLDAAGTVHVLVHVRFGSHCFTEKFDAALHREHHRYTFRNELRAFETTRYECSLMLPMIVAGLFKGTIYKADGSLTYVTTITLSSAPGAQPYSLFFNLELVKPGGADGELPELELVIKSGYIKALQAKKNAQSWRFGKLAGLVSGVFEKTKKPRPTKKTP